MLKHSLFIIENSIVDTVIEDVLGLLLLDTDEKKYDKTIKTNIRIVTGQINSYLMGGAIPANDEIEYTDMPESLIASVVIPMTAGLTRQYMPVKPKTRSMSEGGSSVTYDTSTPTHSINIEDYIKFIRPYRRLGTVRRA